MNQVKCEIHYTKEQSENTGRMQACVIVTCPCGKSTRSWGQSDKSIRRCCWLLSKKCREENFYIEGEEKGERLDYLADIDPVEIADTDDNLPF